MGLGQWFPSCPEWLLLLPLVLANAAQAATSEADPLFLSDEVLEITIEGPLRALARDGAEDPTVRPGMLRYVDESGEQQSMDVGFEPRGKSRRDRDVCTFPPLWLHFEKEAVKGTLFARQKKLKAVTYCRSPRSFQDYIVLEYLAYRIFNELSDASFRVRLLKISFLESGSDKALVRYGFFIEHKKRLARRLGLKVVEPAERIPAASLVPEQASIAELYQYMVSNTDFSFIAPPVGDTCCHNAVLLAPQATAEPVVTADAAFEAVAYLPIPYDFDRTGLVNPPNGEPASELGQRSFRDRVYRGFCRDPAYFAAALETTLAAREAIEGLILAQSQLSNRARDRALKYLAGYYGIVEDPRRRERAFNCRAVH